MILLTHELSSNGLKQVITVGDGNLDVVAIRPHLYKHLSPSGYIKIKLLDANEKEIGETDSVLISDISASSYFHGYVRFDCHFQLIKNTDYVINLVGFGGYSFNESAYVGWCNDFDLRKVSCDYTPNTVNHAALELELWTKNKKQRGSR